MQKENSFNNNDENSLKFIILLSDELKATQNKELKEEIEAHQFRYWPPKDKEADPEIIRSSEELFIVGGTLSHSADILPGLSTKKDAANSYSPTTSLQQLPALMSPNSDYQNSSILLNEVTVNLGKVSIEQSDNSSVPPHLLNTASLIELESKTAIPEVNNNSSGNLCLKQVPQYYLPLSWKNGPIPEIKQPANSSDDSINESEFEEENIKLSSSMPEINSVIKTQSLNEGWLKRSFFIFTCGIGYCIYKARANKNSKQYKSLKSLSADFMTIVDPLGVAVGKEDAHLISVSGHKADKRTVESIKSALISPEEEEWINAIFAGPHSGSQALLKKTTSFKTNLDNNQTQLRADDEQASLFQNK